MTDGSEESAENDVASDEVIDQAPVIPFPTPTDPPTPLLNAESAPEARLASNHPDPAAPAVAAAILFLSPATATLTGQVLRIDPAAPAAG